MKSIEVLAFEVGRGKIEIQDVEKNKLIKIVKWNIVIQIS